MRRTLLAVAVAGAAVGGAAADDERFAERTPPRPPVAHTQANAGNPSSVAWWAVPGLSPHHGGGYVGGARVTHNNALAKGAGAATGPTDSGTFGWDFIGFKLRPGRVFLRSSADPSRGPSLNREYRTDGPKLPDPVAARPVRKAILEAREDKEHREAGGEGE